MEGNLNDWTIFRRYVHGEAWEANTSSVCIDFFKRFGKGTFIDVGANIGMIFVPVVQKAQCSGIAIDASPTNFSYLAANCMRNLPPFSYKLNHVAVGQETGKVWFDMGSINFGDHKVSPNGTVEVNLARFDDLYDASDLSKPILVKLDIQGYEPEFLAGAKNLLANCDALLMEYSPFGKKGDEWIDDYDRAITSNFTKMLRYDTLGRIDLQSDDDIVRVDRSTLDDLKRSISARQWRNIAEGHENIMLFRTRGDPSR
jgi:FkbM family methyltransferase